MNIYILRHASAGTRRANPALDAKRGLDKEGKDQCLLIARFLNTLDIQFDLIASSPLKRALQTASLVGTEMGYDAPIQATDVLAPMATVQSFLEFLDTLSQQENVLLVGHNPNLQQFLGTLIASQNRANIRLRKGAIARVDAQRRPGTLQWIIDPRMIRNIYMSATKSSRRKISKK
jgi:phosphohistidine phosphatase